MGIESSMAIPVTQIVPMMKGKKPKLPARGFQDEEKRRVVRGVSDRICSDFEKRTPIITMSRTTEKTVGIRRT